MPRERSVQARDRVILEYFSSQVLVSFGEEAGESMTRRRSNVSQTPLARGGMLICSLPACYVLEAFTTPIRQYTVRRVEGSITQRGLSQHFEFTRAFDTISAVGDCQTDS